MSLLWQRLYRKWKESQCEVARKKAGVAAANFFGRINYKKRKCRLWAASIWLAESGEKSEMFLCQPRGVVAAGEYDG
ncbi:hypothetical protein BaRGS_00001302 [Batillaria attramentaria]|uniref:Uncharacterized protein n=1 Tax=Batillaria attramentaria TaxID=370345 RepID=A0ABD0M778_9CAEN